MSVRVTVKRDFPEKLFYEKVLKDWKDSVNDRNKGYVITKALEGLKKYPGNVEGYTELRRIKGIGEDIATRLDAAWKYFLEQIHGSPRVTEIRDIKKGCALPYLTNAFVSKGIQRVPFIDKQTLKELSGETGPSASKKKPEKKNAVTASQPPKNDDIVFLDSDDEDIVVRHDVSMSQPVALPSYIAERPISGLKPSTSAQESSDLIYLTYDPAFYEKCEIILIVDGRELGLGRKKTSVADHLQKLNVKYEIRPLSVGDYLWIIRLENNQEIVLDYAIERKTWDDLKSSIRQARYHEQKQRLKKSGIRNVIIIAEGGETADRSLEQALASTAVDNNFFIQRTQHVLGTAKFLAAVTERIKEKFLTEQFIGLSFSSFQAESRKTKSITVSDLFIRQLTVCPLVSVEKAKVIAERFPTWRSLVEFYRCNRNLPSSQRKDVELLMHETLPQINKALSRQLSQFFNA